MDVLRTSLPKSMEPRSNLPYPIESIRKEKELPSFQSPSGGWRLPLPQSSSCNPTNPSPMARLDVDDLEDRRLNPLYSLDNAEIFKRHFMQKECQRIPQPQALGFRNPWVDDGYGSTTIE